MFWCLRPPTSAARTTRRALPSPPVSPGKVLALFRLAAASAITSEGGQKRCVYGELGPTKKRKSVSDVLQPAVVDTVVRHKVHLSDHDVRPDSCPYFPANPRGPVLQRSPESLPRNRLRGGGRWRLQVVKATKGTEARGPDCDRICAFSGEGIVGNKRCALKSTSRQAAACQGSSSTAAEFGRSPSAKSTHDGNSKPTSCNSHTCARTGGQWRGIRQRHLSRCSCRLKGVCSESYGCSRPNWPSEQLTCTQDSTKALPAATVVMGGMIKGQFWIDGPQEEVGFREKPNCLHVLDGRDPVQKDRGGCGFLRQFVLAQLGLLSRGSTSLAATCIVARASGSSPLSSPNELKCVHGGKVPPARSRECRQLCPGDKRHRCRRGT